MKSIKLKRKMANLHKKLKSMKTFWNLSGNTQNTKGLNNFFKVTQKLVVIQN